MSDSVPYANIIILALLAGLILLRLRSVLGTRDENNPQDYSNRPYTTVIDQEPIVQLDEKARPKPVEEDSYLTQVQESDMLRAISDIKAKDPQFSATSFLRGAKSAYEMVFDAFAKGEKATLKRLMSDTIYQHFADELERREKSVNKPEVTLVSVDAKDITQASVTGTTARMAVRFLSEQVSVVRSPSGDIVEGNPSDIRQVEDHWVFERDISSKNPNWKLVET